MPIKFTPATINALTRFVRALDQHRFGAVMLVVVMAAGAVLLAVPSIPLVMT